MLSVFAGLAQFESEQRLSRQAEGIAIVKQQSRMDGLQFSRVTTSPPSFRNGAAAL